MSDGLHRQCAFYFVNFSLDTSFGVFLNFIFLEAFSLLAKRFGWTSVMTPGEYGDPVRVKYEPPPPSRVDCLIEWC